MDLLTKIGIGSVPGSTSGIGSVPGTSPSTMQTILSSMNITGNIMVDSFLIMNAFTLFRTWAEVVVTVVLGFSKALLGTVFHYIISLIKSKLTGKIMFRTEVQETDTLYKILFNGIIDTNLEGDIVEDWKFKWLRIESQYSAHDDVTYFERSKKTDYYHTVPVKLNIDYTSKDERKLKFKQDYGMSDKKTVIFKYNTDPKRKYNDDYFNSSRTFYIRINWEQFERHVYTGNVDGNPPTKTSSKERKMTFDLIMFDVHDKVIAKQVYFSIFYDFLVDKFNNLFSNLIFSYRINFTASNSSNMYLQMYCQCCSDSSFRAYTDGWLKYGDDNFDLVKEIIAIGSVAHIDDESSDQKRLPRVSRVSMLAKPVSLEYDYYRNIHLLNCTEVGSDTTRGIVSRLLQIAGAESSGSGNQGFFQYKDKAVVIQQSSFVILKKGSYVCEDEVYDLFKHLIEANINSSAVSVAKPVVSKKQMLIYKWCPESRTWENTVLSRRSFDTIYLADKLKRSIIKEFDNFVRMEKLYRKVEVPYRKGIMFYGPPGTGKTSLVKALAFEYQIPLYIFDVNADGVNDDTIVAILNSLGGTGLKILLFEDIDTAFADKEKMSKEEKYVIKHDYPVATVEQPKTVTTVANKNDENNKVVTTATSNGGTQQVQQQPNQQSMVVEQTRKFLTYSGLLNAFDGVMSNQTGVITILTTNHIERLGDAFIRPGRVDARFELKECNREQIEVMVKSFIDKSVELIDLTRDECLGEEDEAKKYSCSNLPQRIREFANHLTNSSGESVLKPCEIQSYLLKYIDNPDDLFGNYSELMNKRI